MRRSRTAFLIVAAGRGTRFNSDLPKQYMMLAGMPVLRHTILNIRDHPGIDRIMVVIDPAHRAYYEAAIAGLDLPSPVYGGAERQESVRNGLRALATAAEPPERVLVHDAARPFVKADIIDRVLEALDHAPGAIPALPVTDTLKRAAAEGGQIAGTVDRTGIFRAQTPQGFDFATLLEIHENNPQPATDDAALLEQQGLEVRLVEGAGSLFKITTREDFPDAERMLAPMIEPRTGNGFDVHRLVPGEDITLCGVLIPHDRTLSGHSDADVGLHAITDALLGALADGDIGSHFPPGDPRWKGAASDRFLAHARDLVTARHGRILHVDVTLICEQPKIGPHRDAMRMRIADILGLGAERVSVKATTSERLGFTGRSEGIAAQATATILLPAPHISAPYGQAG